MARKCIDLTGQKFGRLTVIERAENKGIQVCWLCKCECGNEKVIMGTHLKSGNTTSCGCWNSERSSKKMREQWQNEDYRQRQSKKMKEQWQDEDLKKIQSKRMREKWQDEDFRKMRSEKAKEQWQDEDFRELQSKRMKEQWQDEDFKKMESKKMREKWQDEEFRESQSKKMREQWQNEDYRQRQSEKMKEQWQNEEMKWKIGYKGGITLITQHLRHLNIQWYEDCKQKANYTCQLTGQVGGQLNTHHLKAFSAIVIEAHNLHNIKIKPQVKDYTQEELKLLEEYVGSWHKDNSNAIVLSEDVHNLFHKLYGKGNNTPEQYIEFKERYLAGEFKEILK